MAITLGGSRWDEKTPFDDDEELSPLDDDYIPEEYRDEED